MTTKKRDPHADQGTLSVINVKRAGSHPAGAVQATAPAGCDPGRVITTSGAPRCGVTARAGNALLAFSAARLRGCAGLRPREFAVEPGGRTALVTNSASHQLEAVNVSQLG